MHRLEAICWSRSRKTGEMRVVFLKVSASGVFSRPCMKGDGHGQVQGLSGTFYTHNLQSFFEVE